MEIDRQVGDAGLPVLHGGVARVQLVAGRVVAYGAHDAAVARDEVAVGVAAGDGQGVVALHRPVEAAVLPNDREEVHIDAGARNGVLGRIVIGLIRDARRIETVAIRLDHNPLAQRVDRVQLVVALAVGDRALVAAIHHRVSASLHSKRKAGHAGLAALAPAVVVQIGADAAPQVGVPGCKIQPAQVGDLAVLHGNLLPVEQVELILVPPGKLVVAIGHVGDKEVALRVALANPDSPVAALEIVEREPGLGNRLVELRAAQTSPDRARVGEAADAGGVDRNGHDVALDAASGARLHAGRRGGARLDKAEGHPGERLASYGELGVVASGALLHPGVPVVVALKRGSLDPILAVGGGGEHGVAVRAEVGDSDLAVGTGVETAGGDDRVAGVDDRRAVRVEAHVAVRIALVVGADRVAVYVVADLAERIRDGDAEAGQAGLGGYVGRAVGGRVVVEDDRPQGGRGQRGDVQRGRNYSGAAAGCGRGDTEPGPVDLVAVGDDRDKVVAVGEREATGELPAGREVAGIALRDNGRVARLGADRGPVTVGGVARVGLIAAAVAGLGDAADIVLVDDVLKIA